jgi:acetyl-CoA synthetase
VQQRRVTLLGLVPSLVKAWRSSGCVDGLDWQAIRRFSSTGECSNAADMRWLMDCAGGRPVIEYCGGTEIGGAYLTQTLLQPAYPSLFSTPALGLRCEIRDTDGQPAASGELFLAGTSIGLSTDLLGRNHHAEYYAGTPNGSDGQPLRRHGDEVERLPNGYYRALGRADDTMNLGGIKVAAAEIERVLLLEPGLLDCAAVALAPAGGGPSQLVIFAVMDAAAMASPTLQQRLQQRLSTSLNPLFRIAELRLVAALPRTASNKILRRQLRSELQQSAEAVPSSPHPDR